MEYHRLDEHREGLLGPGLGNCKVVAHVVIPMDRMYNGRAATMNTIASGSLMRWIALSFQHRPLSANSRGWLFWSLVSWLLCHLLTRNSLSRHLLGLTRIWSGPQRPVSRSAPGSATIGRHSLLRCSGIPCPASRLLPSFLVCWVAANLEGAPVWPPLVVDGCGPCWNPVSLPGKDRGRTLQAFRLLQSSPRA